MKPHAPLARARSQPYIRWADLTRRVFEADVLLCPHCLGKRRIVAFLEDPLVVPMKDLAPTSHRGVLDAAAGLPRPGQAYCLIPQCLLDVLSVQCRFAWVLGMANQTDDRRGGLV